MQPFRDGDLLGSESNSNEECLSNAAAELVTIDPETQSQRSMPDHDKIAQECVEGSYSKDSEPAELLGQSCCGGLAGQSFRTLHGADPVFLCQKLCARPCLRRTYRRLMS